MSASRICCVVPAGRIGPYDRHTVNDARESRVNCFYRQTTMAVVERLLRCAPILLTDPVPG